MWIPPVQIVLQHNVLPSNRLENVAASLCPGNLYLQLLMLCVAAIEPPCDQKYVCVSSAHIRSTFTLRFNRPNPCPTVLRLLPLPRSEQGGQVESVRTWFYREVMMERRLVTCSVVDRLDWARFSVCVWLARTTL